MFRTVENLVLSIAPDRASVAVDAVQAVVFGDLRRVQSRLFNHRSIVFRTFDLYTMVLIMVDLLRTLRLTILVSLPVMVAGVILDFRRDDHRSSCVRVFRR